MYIHDLLALCALFINHYAIDIKVVHNLVPSGLGTRLVYNLRLILINTCHAMHVHAANS